MPNQLDPIDALKLIAGIAALDIPANANTDPDPMADALELAKRTLAEIQGVAAAAVLGDYYTPPQATPGLTPLETMQARCFRALVRAELAVWGTSEVLETMLDRDFDTMSDAFCDYCAAVDSADAISDREALEQIANICPPLN